MKIAVIGTGYVGLVSGACLAAIGHEVVCVDKEPARAGAINRGGAPFHEDGLDGLIADGVAAQRLSGTTDLAAALQGADLSIIAVGTPSRADGIDLAFVEAAAREIGAILPTLGRYHVVVVKSTCVPGTTDTLVRRALEESSGLTAGEFGLAMNPEFLREGAAVEDFMNPDRIVVGAIDDRSAETIERVYAPFDCPKLRTTPRNAELIKYASNTLLATLISFSNEIAGLCEAVPGLDEAVVMQGLHLDRRLSPLVGGERLRPGILAFLRAGIGYGGSCLPKDTVALAAFARHHGAETSLLDATIGINDARMGRVLDSIERQAGALRGRTVAILGLAFKPGTDDIRESPGIRLARGAIERGARVRAWDPIATENARRELTDAVAYAASLDEALAGAELAILATAWPELADADWAALSQRMARPVLFDGRSVLAGVRLPDGIAYLTIGRTAR